ncbi:MAG: zinc ribbon domain-containing protein [Planctomycetes bacterium]|nr:zinc ribbon domain-containing protein [Planctomycetota bacterium]
MPTRARRRRQIPAERKVFYYFGMVSMVVGLLVFGSTFVSSAMHFGDFTNFDDRGSSLMGRAIVGMALMFVGGVLRSIGARGLAGSGVVLDPERARGELEPYSRMAGGMVKDALDEADIDLGARPEKVVMVKCRACGKLNEEDSKFCQECGQAI